MEGGGMEMGIRLKDQRREENLLQVLPKLVDGTSAMLVDNTSVMLVDDSIVCTCMNIHSSTLG